MNNRKTNWPILAAMVLITAMAVIVVTLSKSQCACAQTLKTITVCKK